MCNYGIFTPHLLDFCPRAVQQPGAVDQGSIAKISLAWGKEWSGKGGGIGEELAKSGLHPKADRAHAPTQRLKLSELFRPLCNRINISTL